MKLKMKLKFKKKNLNQTLLSKNKNLKKKIYCFSITDILRRIQTYEDLVKLYNNELNDIEPTRFTQKNLFLIMQFLY